MINSFFVDSSVLVEYLKNSKTRLLDELLGSTNGKLFVNETVVSEFFLYFLLINGERSARSLKEARMIALIIQANKSFDLINGFSYLANTDKIFKLVPQFMSTYNLLPNDAIILATCKLHGITKLVSHDRDFIVPCKAEGIELLSED